MGDDLSGVVSVSGELASRGLSTVLPRNNAEPVGRLLGPDGAWPRIGTAVAVNTDSRHDRPDIAREKVVSASRMLSGLGADVLVKKVDSLLRGNIGPELAGGLEGSGARAALCVFAAPSQGRTTVGGEQLVDGEPVGRHDPGSYLRFGPRGAGITSLLGEHFGDRVRSLSLDAVKSGRAAIGRDLDAFLTDPGAVVVCDATEVGHVVDCTAVALSRGVRLLAGTSDLCGAVADALVAEGRLEAGHPVLIVSGTASRMGRIQVEDAVAADASGTAIRGVSRLVEVPPGVAGGTLEDYARRAAALLAAGENVLVCPEGPPKSASGGSAAVARALAEVCARALDASRVCGVVATGGETAEAVLDRLDAHGLAIGRDVIPGVPEAAVLGGPRAGMRFVAKTGAYGGPDALRTIAGWLRSCNELFDASVGGPEGPPETRKKEM